MEKKDKKPSKINKNKLKSIELSEPLLARAFGLERTFTDTPLLKQWLSANGVLEPFEKHFLDEVCHDLLENTDFWNEEELKMHFISMIIRLANFQNPLKVFFDREIQAEIEGILVKTEADMLVSKGFGDIIETPYLAIEFEDNRCKSEIIGKLIKLMLMIQAKNNDGKPVHGCYVQGRFCFFSILQGKKYVISNSFNASESDQAQKIVFILRKIKELVNN